MDRNNILTVLENLMKSTYFHCEWGIEWEEKQNFIDLIFQFSLANPQGEAFTDFGNNLLDLEILPFEFRIVFYDGNLLENRDAEYIQAFSVDYQEGIYYGELHSIVKYLRNLTAKVRLDWYEFIHSNDPVFKVEWNQDEFNQVRQTLIDTNRYSGALVYFPREIYR